MPTVVPSFLLLLQVMATICAAAHGSLKDKTLKVAPRYLRPETACAFNAEVKTRAVSEESGAKFQQLPILYRVPQTVGMELKQKRHSVNSGGEGDGGGAKIAT